MYYSSFCNFLKTVIFALVNDEFLTEAETLPHYQAFWNLGGQCLMARDWYITPYASKQQGTAGNDTEQFLVVSRRMINFIFH